MDTQPQLYIDISTIIGCGIVFKTKICLKNGEKRYFNEYITKSTTNQSNILVIILEILS